MKDVTTYEQDSGLLLAQWIVRIVGALLLAVLAAALVGSADDIKRYLRIRSM